MDGLTLTMGKRCVGKKEAGKNQNRKARIRHVATSICGDTSPTLGFEEGKPCLLPLPNYILHLLPGTLERDVAYGHSESVQTCFVPKTLGG